MHLNTVDAQDDPLKLGVDLDMFHMNNGATDGAMGFSTALNSEMGSTGVWRRDQVGAPCWCASTMLRNSCYDMDYLVLLH